ncbi:MAG: rod shape-determining protein MreC [Clostridia bacterium]|nr:rod shape-determining protein MreC [Clostridia bacterium]
MYNNNEKKGKIGIFITIIILIILVIITNIEGMKLTGVENVVGKLVSPVQNGITFLKNKFSGNSDYSNNLEQLNNENQKLKNENSELEKKLRELEVIQAENETLKSYLGLTEKYPDYKTIPAYVINKDISNYSKTIIINAGSKDGIKEKMTVIAENGLVGYVVSVTSDTAKVQTIVDSASSTSVITSTTRDNMVCKGTIENTNKLKGMYISANAGITEGDGVETSGMGGIYPKGIYIGKVTKLVEGKNKTDNYAEVEIEVDFEKLETVLVITE